MMVGLIAYDAFFVFGTSLMNPVDWKLPQFIKYPTSHGYNILGGGDITLPGLIIAYLYRYDAKHPARSRIFFLCWHGSLCHLSLWVRVDSTILSGITTCFDLYSSFIVNVYDAVLLVYRRVEQFLSFQYLKLTIYFSFSFNKNLFLEKMQREEYAEHVKKRTFHVDVKRITEIEHPNDYYDYAISMVERCIARAMNEGEISHDFPVRVNCLEPWHFQVWEHVFEAVKAKNPRYAIEYPSLDTVRVSWR